MSNNENLALRRYGDHGWKWTEKLDGDVGKTFRTNGNGDGLFSLDIRDDGAERWFQRLGSSQYSLPSDRDGTIRCIDATIATIDELETMGGKF